MAHTRAFHYFSELVFEYAGIKLEKDKLYLVQTRLAGICREHHCADITELSIKLGNAMTRELVRKIVEAMTTNETWWFRDIEMFNVLKAEIWPKLLTRSPNGLNMWSAACSTGQEPYSLRMAWAEFPSSARSRLSIVATDLDTQVLERARKATYSDIEIARGLTPAKTQECFTKAGTSFTLKENLRTDIQWREFNLVKDSHPSATFDVILCRNVLIYFDKPGKERVLDMIHKALKPDGWFFVGGSESLFNLNHHFERIVAGKTFAYIKKK